MLSALTPMAICSKVNDVDLKRLVSMGIRTLLVDLDNTLVRYQEYEFTEDLGIWVNNAKQMGLSVCILSNSRKNNAVKELAKRLGIKAIARAGKPFRSAYSRAFALCDCQPQHTATIGDQVFTDVLGGNRAGCYTILVTPLGKREFVGTRLMRFFESFVLQRIVSAEGRDGR